MDLEGQYFVSIRCALLPKNSYITISATIDNSCQNQFLHLDLQNGYFHILLLFLHLLGNILL